MSRVRGASLRELSTRGRLAGAAVGAASGPLGGYDKWIRETVAAIQPAARIVRVRKVTADLEGLRGTGRPTAPGGAAGAIYGIGRLFRTKIRQAQPTVMIPFLQQ